MPLERWRAERDIDANSTVVPELTHGGRGEAPTDVGHVTFRL